MVVAGLLILAVAGGYVWYRQAKNQAATEKGAYDTTLKPRLEMTNITINEVDDDSVSLNVSVLIDNPLPVGFRARSLRYTVYVAKTPVVEEQYAKPIAVRAGDRTLLTLPMKLRHKQLIDVVKTLEQKGIDSTTYGVRAAFELEVPILGERTFTQTIETRRPVIYLPDVKIEHIDLGKLGLKRTDVAATVAVTNRNRMPLSITDTYYQVVIDGKEIAEGHQPDPILIRKQAATSVVFPLTLKPGQSMALLPKFLFDKKDTPFRVLFRCKLLDKGKNPVFDRSQFNTVVRGTLADLKKD